MTAAVRVYSSVRTSSFLPSNVISEDTQFVRAKIDSAFRFIAGTVTQLNANPINANVDSLFEMLFGRSARQTPNSDVLRRMTAFGAISAFNNNDQTTPGIQPGGNGIIVVRFIARSSASTKSAKIYTATRTATSDTIPTIRWIVLQGATTPFRLRSP
jgi:hypothetical protein